MGEHQYLEEFSEHVEYYTKMKKGDVLTLIATLMTFDDESKIQHFSIKKTLNHQYSESEE